MADTWLCQEACVSLCEKTSKTSNRSTNSVQNVCRKNTLMLKDHNSYTLLSTLISDSSYCAKSAYIDISITSTESMIPLLGIFTNSLDGDIAPRTVCASKNYSLSRPGMLRRSFWQPASYQPPVEDNRLATARRRVANDVFACLLALRLL